MKFKFPYQKILEHKELERELAYKDFIQARDNHSKGNSILEEMYDTVTATRSEAQNLVQSSAKKDVGWLQYFQNFYEGQSVRIQRQRVELRKLNQDLEIAQDQLQEKAKEYKIFEKLKERMWFQFKKEVKRKELKETDELVTMMKKKES